MNSGSRRRRVLAILVCVLLVAALTGQPAWGEGKPGDGTSGAASSGNGAAMSEGRSGTAQGPANAERAAAAETSVKQRQSPETPEPPVDPEPIPPEGPPGPTPVPTPDPPPDPTPVPTPDPPPDPTPVPTPDPPPGPPPDPTPDPTPPPPGEPPPVDPGVVQASPEVGAEAPAPPSAPEVPVQTPGLSLATAEAPPILTEADFLPAGPTGRALRAQPETASRESINTKLTTPPVTPIAPDPTDPESPPSTIAPSPDAPAGPTDPRDSARPAPDRAIPGTPAGAAAGNPILAGATLPPAARDLVTQRPGAATSRSRDREASGVGWLRAPGSLGLNQIANLVKDIPAEIKLALAGLASLVLLLGAYTVLAAVRTRRLERQRAKLMEDIGLLQAALLPAVPSRLGALLTTVAYRPADGPAAGGDFYDAFALSDGRVGLVLGDISGHGRQALAQTTLVRFTVRAHLEAGMSPREALAISGRSLDGRLSEDFSTALAAIHDPVKGTLTYASAGHPPPLVVGPQAHEPVTASSAPPIGAGFPTGQRQTVLPMPQGTTVCVYSDGLLEARLSGELLGRGRLCAWLAELGSQATAKALLDLVVQRAERVPDDLAACVLHAAPGATAPASRLEQLKLDVLDVEGPELEGFLRACEVSHADRAIAARRVAEQLAVSGGVVVEVRIGEHPMVSVASIGEHSSGGSRPAARARRS